MLCWRWCRPKPDATDSPGRGFADLISQVPQRDGVTEMQTRPDRNPTSFTGQIVRDAMPLAMLAVVGTLIGIRSVVRGARILKLLPHKDAFEPC